MAAHHYETLAAFLLADGRHGPSFATYLAEAVVNQSPRRTEFNDRQLLNKLAHALAKHQRDVYLPILAASIESGSASVGWRLEGIVGSTFRSGNAESSPLFAPPLEPLMKACRDNPKRFAQFVARTAPLFDVSNEGTRAWTALALALFDQFGNQKSFLSTFSANMHTGSWSGPTSTYLETFLAPLNQLSQHRHRTVRQWAKSEEAYIQSRMKDEQVDEEERALRRA